MLPVAYCLLSANMEYMFVYITHHIIYINILSKVLCTKCIALAIHPFLGPCYCSSAAYWCWLLIDCLSIWALVGQGGAGAGPGWLGWAGVGLAWTRLWAGLDIPGPAHGQGLAQHMAKGWVRHMPKPGFDTFAFWGQIWVLVFNLSFCRGQMAAKI